MYSRLDRIPSCDGRTAGQTNGQTDILSRHSPRYAYASRVKNDHAATTLKWTTFNCWFETSSSKFQNVSQTVNVSSLETVCL